MFICPRHLSLLAYTNVLARLCLSDILIAGIKCPLSSLGDGFHFQGTPLFKNVPRPELALDRRAFAEKRQSKKQSLDGVHMFGRHLLWRGANILVSADDMSLIRVLEFLPSWHSLAFEEGAQQPLRSQPSEGTVVILPEAFPTVCTPEQGAAEPLRGLGAPSQKSAWGSARPCFARNVWADGDWGFLQNCHPCLGPTCDRVRLPMW